jgi:hypothetical protein
MANRTGSGSARSVTAGEQNRGYAAGERIAIKINLTTRNARSGSSTVDPLTYEKKSSIMNKIDTSPQMMLKSVLSSVRLIQRPSGHVPH